MVQDFYMTKSNEAGVCSAQDEVKKTRKSRRILEDWKGKYVVGFR